MTRDFPPTRHGILRPRRLLGALTAGVLGLSLCLGTAYADDLTDRRDELQRQAEQTKRDLSESTAGLTSAVSALEAAESELESARATLAATQQALAEARAYDEKMQAKLAKAQKQLEKARIAVADNQLELDHQLAMVGEVARAEYQQRTNLMEVAVLLQTESQSDLQTKMQWSTTMFDTTEAGMDRLRELQAKLEAAEEERVRIEAQVAADRKAAAENVELKASLEAQAEAETAAVASLVEKSDSARQAAEQEVAADEARYEELTAERSAVEQRIADRIAEAERKRKAEEQAAARQAEEERAAAQRAEERAAAERSRENRSSGGSSKASEPRRQAQPKPAPEPAAQPADTSFAMPVNGPITSKYGMRLHPVTGIYKLHDGTDFGVGCGVPIRAPYSGTVSEKYFNSGYGNRLVIDHGRVKGSYVSTIMNHATHYSVGVGQRVSKGQVVGYVGSTGYSTGCHLHLMVTKGGSTVNPMSSGLF
ncbi:M23 family metallopeptidase [Auraticoccus monumenti]|uniref:Murein DD-endopeptidase MepM and murein hydrolase activator NlpD, contain LysM domain n=1 Tax=Auraticoccus monumenti TaxID=675864 RepID=A0A1G7E668_9ACTN|nr:M23 family metallopeptidase [Auraticoccus monumenti]SDE59162.1 Murein DD-endopeptidase MepM and murein hydrolase activator NlpD, contain LysM domain [Auraticoccus monumenti]